MRRSGGTSALLAKVNAQLRGERVPITRPAEDDDGVGAYLSSLGSKKAKEDVDWSKLAEMSDLSGEDDEVKPTSTQDAGGSKFLKKKTAEAPPVKASKSVPVKSSKTAIGAKSSALSKVAAFTSKYSKSANKPQLSDSDLDLDLSMDEEVMADVRNVKNSKTSATASSKPASSATFKRQMSSDLSEDSELAALKSGSKLMKSKSKFGASSGDDEDDSIGKGGSKFLKKKKKPQSEPVEVPTQAEKPSSPAKNVKRPSKFRLPSSDKYSTQVVLDTDEESMAEYMRNMSPSSSGELVKTPRSKSPPSARRKAFLKANLSPKDVPAASVDSMQDIREEDDQPSESQPSSIEDDFRLNVMGLDDLEPALPLPASPEPAKKASAKKKPEKEKSKPATKDSKKKRDSRPEIFNELGLFSVDDLLGDVGDLAANDSDVSEVRDADGVETDLESWTARSGQPLRSILSSSPKPPGTPKSSRSRVRLSLGDLEEIRSRSPTPEAVSSARPVSSRQYSSDFDEVSEAAASIQTDPAESEAASIATESRSPSPVRSRRSSSYSERRRSSPAEYSDDFASDAETMTGASRRSSGASGATTPRSSSRDESVTYTDEYTSHTDSAATSRSSWLAEDASCNDPTLFSTPSSPRRGGGGGGGGGHSVEIQTDAEPGLLYHWNLDGGGGAPFAALGPRYGLGSVDPTPIATHTISADALETLTSYNPSALALNEMLRQQLELTTQFLDSHKRMHQAYVRNLEPDYVYTTLEDTKNYIKQHRKPVLTFDEALKQVRDEMGLSGS